MLLDLEEKTRVLVEDIVERSAIGRGAIFVLGLSSSEVAGGTIGKASSREIGQRIVKTMLAKPSKIVQILSYLRCGNLHPCTEFF